MKPIRPWKVFTFSIGLGWLLFGALHYKLLDWDIGVSLVMAVFTYLTAEKSIHAFRKMKHLPEAIFWTWFTVDGSYTVYHVTVGNELLREAQWPTSLCLYLLCGLIWSLDNVEQTYDRGSNTHRNTCRCISEPTATFY